MLLLFFAIAGCAANPGIVQMSPDTYLLSREDKGGIFGNASAMHAAVIDEANKFAASKGKVAIPITTHETAMGPGHFATFDYQFRLVDPNSPDAKSTPMIQRPDVVVQQNENKSVEVHSTTVPPKPDVYTELLKLDDLRKKGIITDEEFQAQKAKLLAQ
ncbi:MAG: SHOCT domain-containing protein [Steroidobacteraceae bacterium]